MSTAPPGRGGRLGHWLTGTQIGTGGPIPGSGATQATGRTRMGGRHPQQTTPSGLGGRAMEARSAKLVPLPAQLPRTLRPDPACTASGRPTPLLSAGPGAPRAVAEALGGLHPSFRGPEDIVPAGHALVITELRSCCSGRGCPRESRLTVLVPVRRSKSVASCGHFMLCQHRSRGHWPLTHCSHRRLTGHTWCARALPRVPAHTDTHAACHLSPWRLARMRDMNTGRHVLGTRRSYTRFSCTCASHKQTGMGVETGTWGQGVCAMSVLPEAPPLVPTASASASCSRRSYSLRTLTATPGHGRQPGGPGHCSCCSQNEGHVLTPEAWHSPAVAGPGTYLPGQSREKAVLQGFTVPWAWTCPPASGHQAPFPDRGSFLFPNQQNASRA